MELKVGLQNAIVVAHPDDETLWAGGLPVRFRDKQWNVIVCSIPRIDPQRVGRLKAACDFLHAAYTYLPITETAPGEKLNGLETLDLSTFDCIFTHNSAGEYGHSHHKHVHERVLEVGEGKPIYTFGFRNGKAQGKYLLQLEAPEVERKLRALKCYNTQSPTDKKPKWEALLDLYCKEKGLPFAYETYDLVGD